MSKKVKNVAIISGLALAGLTVAAPAYGQAFVPGESPIGGATYNPDTPEVVTIGGQAYGLEPSMRPGADTSTDFRLSPAGDVLYARKFATSGASVCTAGNSGGGQRVVFYRINNVPSPSLVEIAEACIPLAIQRTTFVGSAADSPYTALIVTDVTGPNVELRWFDLLSSQQVRATQVPETLGDIRFAPNGALAWVQADLGSSSIGVDYHLFDLCDGRLGDRVTPDSGLANFSNTDPYTVIYGTTPDGQQRVNVSIGDNFTTTVLAPPCHAAGTAVGKLAVSISATAVSPADNLVDFTIQYEVSGNYEPATLFAMLPSETILVSNPNQVVQNNQITLNDLLGVGEVTIRTRVLPGQPTQCLGIQPQSRVSLTSAWTITNAQGNPEERSVQQVAAPACVAGPQLEVRRIVPASAPANVPFDVRFEYTNVGDLLATDVKIEDQASVDRTQYTVVGSNDPGFRRDGIFDVGFDLGNLPGGTTGVVSYQVIASCAAASLQTTNYSIASDGNIVVFPRNEESTTIVEPLSEAPMPGSATVNAPLATAAPGDTRTFAISFSNPAPMNRPISFRASAEPCWRWINVGGEGEVVIFNDIGLTWRANVAAQGVVTMTASVERKTCSEGAAINFQMPVAVTFACGLNGQLDLAGAVTGDIPDAGMGTPDAGQTGDTGSGGNDAGSGRADAGTDGGGSSGGGGCTTTGSAADGGLWAVLFGTMLWLRRRPKAPSTH